MSKLSVGSLEGLSVNNNRITVATGSTLQAPGHVLQVQSGTKRDAWSSSSNGISFYEVSGYSVTITPQSATSKILVMGTIQISSNYWEIQGRLYRNGASIDEATGNPRGSRTRVLFGQNLYQGAGAVRNGYDPVSFQYLDSPSTTAATTYSVALNGYSSYAIGVNYHIFDDYDNADYHGQAISTITAMEIAQ
jgi:hypothetical protein